MAFYQLHKSQKVNCSLDEIWDFISSPKNLKEITPDHMGFDITSKDTPDEMYPGLIISYKVSPLLGLKMSWMSEITQVRHKSFFVDEQRVGPYKMWHHQHFVEEIEGGGVIMRDIVTYQPPLGILGAIMNSLVIKKKLEEIFDYRSKAVEEKYGVYVEKNG
jgi:ligand-binding SRPBCC domain-containing protein